MKKHYNLLILKKENTPNYFSVIQKKMKNLRKLNTKILKQELDFPQFKSLKALRDKIKFKKRSTN